MHNAAYRLNDKKFGDIVFSDGVTDVTIKCCTVFN